MIDRVQSSTLQPAYSSMEVFTLTGVSLRQLQWWDEQGVVSPLQVGHRRLYNTLEILQVSLIMGLRRKGISLQKIRRLLSQLEEEVNGGFLEMHRSGPDVFLLTDGKTVHVERSAVKILDILRASQSPINTICISDLIRKIEPGKRRRKPVRSQTVAARRRRAKKAS